MTGLVALVTGDPATLTGRIAYGRAPFVEEAAR
jgi:hypothetical protein